MDATNSQMAVQLPPISETSFAKRFSFQGVLAPEFNFRHESSALCRDRAGTEVPEKFSVSARRIFFSTDSSSHGLFERGSYPV